MHVSLLDQFLLRKCILMHRKLFVYHRGLLSAAVLSFQLSSATEIGIQSKGKAAAREQQGPAAGRKEE